MLAVERAALKKDLLLPFYLPTASRRQTAAIYKPQYLLVRNIAILSVKNNKILYSSFTL